MSDQFLARFNFVLSSTGKLQKEIAAECGLSPARLSSYARGKSEPSLEILSAICRAIGVSADYLLGLSDSRALAAPISISTASVPRDPLANLTPEQRTVIETSLAAFRAQNLARETQEA